MEKWNKFCDEIDKLKTSKTNENVVQQLIENVLSELLNWSKLNGEIVSRMEIPIGANNRLIPDVILKKDNKNIIVIELKKVTKQNTVRITQQLKSYMRQLKLKYGIFIGNKIEFFYDDDAYNEIDPVKVVSIDIEKGNMVGVELFSIIDKNTIDNKKLEEFSVKYLKKEISQIEAKQIEKELNGSNELINKIFVKGLEQEYKEDVLEYLKNNLSVEIKKTNAKTEVTNKQQIEKEYESKVFEFRGVRYMIFPIGSKLSKYPHLIDLDSNQIPAQQLTICRDYLDGYGFDLPSDPNKIVTHSAIRLLYKVLNDDPLTSREKSFLR
ncbi:type I restriction enzyme HsdR N-terminal domain-containing protein [Haploplasma axanthum]|uniref:Type I restriction enzyme R protein N-terminal domain-containing protein n=1 Tax=Haploplasma axanthum TaxID=29552 RepID=A0A449BBT8_HAPAX|nr:type I restriction enzyme HsdR N-terminal domain-containing protein [Haploplasma axanthum]VEU79892.1 Uncharacterised protein [Haploplasma axanthum]